MATKDIIIDIAGDGDIHKIGFDIQLTSSISEWQQQKLWIKFKTFFAELWLDTSKGIPYNEAVLVKNPDLLFIASILKEQILEEELVETLIFFKITDFDSLTRSITFSWEAQMTTGEIIGGIV